VVLNLIADVRCASNSDQIDAAPRNDAMCQLLTHAVQQTAPLFDHRVGTGEFPWRCKAVSGVSADNGSGPPLEHLVEMDHLKLSVGTPGRKGRWHR
jgi:hypothetical protein